MNLEDLFIFLHANKETFTNRKREMSTTRKSAEKRELQFIEHLNKPIASDLQECASFLV